MDAVAGLVLIVFIITYVAISSEKVNRTATSLLGMGIVGIILVAAGQGSFNLIVEHIEWHTVLFVTSMMMIVTIATATGMFQYLAIELTKPSAGDTKKLFVSFLGFVFGV
ncbi:MAG: SLC13 family permease, partial [Candidatus Thorarchaeota archaeon]